MDIEKYFLTLNSEGFIPKYSFRRNFPYYKFISYLNNSIGCYLSKNYSALYVFLIRLYKEKKYLIDNNLIKDEDKDYFNLCDHYFNDVKEFLLMNNHISEEEIEKINNIY